MDLLFSADNDPAKGAAKGGEQAVELYGLYRGDLSLNGALGTSAFTLNPFLRDVSMQVGFDANTKNTSFAPAKKLLTFGPNFHFNVPGFLNIALHVAHEWNYNGIVGKSVDFDTTFEAEMVWAIPLAFTGLPLKFQGFMNVVAPKGRDGFGANTKTEVLAEPRLSLDVGALAFDKPNKFEMSLGYQYWLNKFGNNHENVPGSLASTVFVAARYHF
jgi:nucleoside-specific outer membrane channel protein Tsx